MTKLETGLVEPEELRVLGDHVIKLQIMGYSFPLSIDQLVGLAANSQQFGHFLIVVVYAESKRVDVLDAGKRHHKGFGRVKVDLYETEEAFEKAVKGRRK